MPEASAVPQIINAPVWGLPASLLAKQGESVRILALMQTLGLNRDERKKAAGRVSVYSYEDSAFPHLSQTDQKVIGLFANPATRFQNFWKRVLQVQSPQLERRKYVLYAPDWPVLREFDENLQAVVLEDVDLTQHLPEWNQLSSSIRARLGEQGARIPLGVFSLWPRLIERLKGWDDSEPSMHMHLAEVVFSLSSVAGGNFLIGKALEVRPELKAYLTDMQPTLKKRKATPPARGTPSQKNLLLSSDPNGNDAENDGESMNDFTNVEDAVEIWSTSVDRASLLIQGLRETPSSTRLLELKAIVGTLEACLPELKNEEAQFNEKLTELIHAFQLFLQSRSFALIDSSYGAQIEARWRQRHLKDRDNSAATANLIDDLKHALERGEIANQAYAQARLRREGIDSRLNETNEAIFKPENKPKKFELLQSITSLTDQRTACDRELLEHEKNILAAYSPLGESFELSEDYISQLRDTTFVDSNASIQSAINLSEDTLTRPSEIQQATTEDQKNSSPTASGPDFGKELVETRSVINEHSDKPPEAGEGFSTDEPSVLPSGLDQPKAADFSPTAGERCAPIWTALRLNLFGAAYWMARSIEADVNSPPVVPPGLIASVALANEIAVPEGEIASKLTVLYAQFQDSWFSGSAEIPNHWTEALNLLAFAGTLKPSILAPATGAASIAGLLHLANPTLHKIRQVCEKFSARSQGFRVDIALFKAPREKAEWNRQLDDLSHEVSAWLDRAPNMKLLFQAASQVWQVWVKPDGIVSSLLDPIVNNDFNRAAEVQRTVIALATAVGVERQVKETDRRIIRRRGEDIHSRALGQLTIRINEALQFSRRWLALVESRPERSDALQQLLDDFVTELQPLIAAALKELGEATEFERFGLVDAGRRPVITSLKRLQALLDQSDQTELSERNSHEVLGDDLPLTPSIHVQLDWTPSEPIAELEDPLAAWLISNRDPQSAFEERIRRGDLLNAGRVLNRIEAASSSTHTPELRTRLLEEVRTHREQLRRKIDHARAEIEGAIAHGLIPETTRVDKENLLVSIEAQLESIQDFGPSSVVLEEIATTLAEKKKAATATAVIRFEKLNNDSISPAVAEEVRQSIASGDILTANEYLQRLEDGSPIHATADEEASAFKQYFPVLANEIDEYLESTPASDVSRAVGRGIQAVGPLSFTDIDQVRRATAQDSFEAWLGIKSAQSANRDRLRKVLSSLGFHAIELSETKGKIGARQEYTLRVDPIEDRAICAIPHFGSRARGRYRIVCVWPRQGDDDISKIVGDTSLAEATVVLYFSRLNDRKRAGASRTARESHRSFLLVDESLLIYLLSKGGASLTTLFRTTLPFAYSLPYEPTSGVVPTEMFYGRLEELQAVQSLSGRCFMYGGRQLGKTALLRKTERDFHRPNENRHAYWIDLRASGIGVNREALGIWSDLWREMKKSLNFPPDFPEPNPNIKGRIERFLEAFKAFLELRPQMRVLLLLDEADSFFEDDGKQDFRETRRLKELMTAAQWRFKVVFAGLHNVLRTTEQANHPLAHLGEPIKVGPLLEGPEWRDAEELVRRPFLAAGFEFSRRSLITRVLAQTNYYPSLIQLYCHHLLRHMLDLVATQPRLAGPRYLIEERDIDSVYRRPALRDEIRSKFQLTLQLDTRYEVIAYSLAYEAVTGKSQAAEGLSVREISQRSRGWWPEGFNGTSDVAFRVLLEEMIGLGVLRQLSGGNYSLRNPNVLLLLGNSDDITDVLLRDRELPVEFEPASFRAERLGLEASSSRNPLTFQQRKVLSLPKSEVVVLVGSQGLGLNDVVTFLEDKGDCELLEVGAETMDLKEFRQKLQTVSGHRVQGRTLFVVQADSIWNEDWLDFALQFTAKLHSQEKTLRVLFLANPEISWWLISKEILQQRESVVTLELQLWRDRFIRQWLIDLGLRAEKPDREAMQSIAGTWPFLLQIVAHAPGATVNAKVKSATEDLRNLDPLMLAAEMGLRTKEPVTLLAKIAALEVPETEEDLSVLLAEEPSDVGAVLAWAEKLQIATKSVDGQWIVEPIARSILLRVSK